MSKRNWTIIYSDFSGMEQKAVEHVSAEMGKYLNRDKGVYVLHVLPCVKSDTLPEGNAVIIGTYDNSKLISKYISKEEIPQNGYLVKVFDNPENESQKIAIITGDNKQSVFYGAIDFTDDYFAFATPESSSLHLNHELFEQEIFPNYCHSSAPKFKTRSVFTWGHPITNYREYIKTMAHLKFNQLIIWNDFVPVNANDVVDYAHEYGIEVIWGYSWGWRKRCADEEYLKGIMSDLDNLKQRILDEYEEKYSKIKGDGIYFQSFTELSKNAVGDKVVAEVVSDFVNDTANALLQRYPNLHIQFGLHAMSVRDKMSYLSKIDSRIEILWEDCGSFPYNYRPEEVNDEYFDKTVKFTEEMIKLREVNPMGLVYKGQMVMQWTKFENQKGPYILGAESAELIQEDCEFLRPIWRNYQAEWIKYGRRAYDMTNEILKLTGGNVNMTLAGTLFGGMWLPYAMTAEMFWDCTTDYDEMLEKIMRRQSLRMA